MSSLRDAFNKAIVHFEQELAAEVVHSLKGSVVEVVEQLEQTYYAFFYNLYNEVLNKGGGYFAGDHATVTLLDGETYPQWTEVSERWFKLKDRAKQAGDPQAQNFYHGVTRALAKGIPLVRKSPGKRRPSGMIKKNWNGRSRKSLDEYLQGLSSQSKSATVKFFGPLNVSYSLKRPDGGQVTVKQLDNLIQKINQRDRKGRYADPIDGTVITTSIEAFTKLSPTLDAYDLWRYMSSVSGEKKQWVKTSAGSGILRPLVGPLINWYVEKQFAVMVEDISTLR